MPTGLRPNSTTGSTAGSTSSGSTRVDKVFTETIAENKLKCKREPGRGLVKIAHSPGRDDGGWAICGGRSYRQRHSSGNRGMPHDGRQTRGEEAGWVVKDGCVWATPISIALDGSYRNRNHASHAVNVIASIQLMEPDHRGCKNSVIDAVTFGRHILSDAPLGPVCALSRDGGECHIHGKEEDWKVRISHGDGAPPDVHDAAKRLRVANCYSCTGLRSPLSAPGTEHFGVRVLCLRLLLDGFWVESFAHDQDAGVGLIVRSLFGDPLECLDRAHIQKNLKKALVTFMPGYASRVCRNFAYVVPKAKELEAECADGSITRSEAFAEMFVHIIYHLQGDHTCCTSDCAGVEEVLEVDEEPRPGNKEQPD
ncbi:unnamed protein product, partial [Pylaiella littoralis]